MPQMDFDKAIAHSRMYKQKEALNMNRHIGCNLLRKGESSRA
ncbi:MAG: hypothetical protein ACOX85_08380 [Candidatus Pararuminococcus gallinarum]